jgi:DNA-binding transcriptional ArsR family regulator
MRDRSPGRSEAELFGLLASSVSTAILETLRSVSERTVAQISRETGEDASVVRRHVMAMRDLGLLRARVADDGVWCGAVDLRVYQLLEIATELLAAATSDRPRDTDRRGDLAAASSSDG